MPNPARIADNFPHQLSGGMRQRAMIAMALSCTPTLLIADEPTTALDVTTEAQILDLMRDLQSQIGTSIMFVTHNMGVVAQMCDEVAVMYLGRVVERATVDDIFYDPKHPYTVSLLRSIPRLGARAARAPGIDQRDRSPTRIRRLRAAHSTRAAQLLCRACAIRLCRKKPLSLETRTILYAATCIPAARRGQRQHTEQQYQCQWQWGRLRALAVAGPRGNVCPAGAAVERRISADARLLYTRGCT